MKRPNIYIKSIIETIVIFAVAMASAVRKDKINPAGQGGVEESRTEIRVEMRRGLFLKPNLQELLLTVFSQRE